MKLTLLKVLSNYSRKYKKKFFSCLQIANSSGDNNDHIGLIRVQMQICVKFGITLDMHNIALTYIGIDK